MSVRDPLKMDSFAGMSIMAESQRRGAALARLDAPSRPLADKRADWARVVAAAPTDLALNARDVCGDGDQSALPPDWHGPGGSEAFLRADLLFNLWGDGADWVPGTLWRGFFGEGKPEDPTVPDFTRACWKGELAVVQNAIARARAEDAAAAGAGTSAGAGAMPAQGPAGAPPASALTRLLETRCLVLRFSPLHACIDGSRQLAHFEPRLRSALAAEVPGGWRHLEVARALVAAGARVDAKDVAGVSALAHCGSSVAGPVTLAIGAELARAGADPRTVNRRGTPILASPVMQRQLDILKAVVSWGADPLQTMGGEKNLDNALNMARKSMWTEGASVLEEAAARLAEKARNAALVGQRVRLARLVGKPELNGRAAIVEGVHPTDAARLSVRVLARAEGPEAEDADTGAVIAVKRANVDFVDPEARDRLGACGGCGGDAFFRCRGCLRAFYCGPDCQKRDWPAHKAPCKAARSALAVIPLPTEDEDADGGVHLDMAQILALASGGGQPSARAVRAASHGARVPRPALGEPFAVKVQVPLIEMGNSPDENLLNIYDEKRSVQNYLSPRVGGGAPHRLLTEAVKAGALKVKGYFLAKLEEREGRVCLVVDPSKLLPAQPW